MTLDQLMDEAERTARDYCAGRELLVPMLHLVTPAGHTLGGLAVGPGPAIALAARLAIRELRALVAVLALEGRLLHPATGIAADVLLLLGETADGVEATRAWRIDAPAVPGGERTFAPPPWGEAAALVTHFRPLFAPRYPAVGERR